MASRLEIDARTRRLILVAFLLLAALSIHRLFLAEPPQGEAVLVLEGETMGTTYEIRIAGSGLGEALRARAEQETERRLAEIDAWMSSWNPDSEISRFNAHRSTEPFPVSFETAELVAFAIELGKWSSGAFDITVSPLVGLWGFGNQARMDETPDPAEIEALMAHMGPRSLRVGRGNPTNGGFLMKATPQVQVDLSAIAKGYGVDHVAGGLLGLDREDFLVEIGGEVLALGERPGGGGWRVAIETPLDEGRAIHSVVELRDQAMATSGDYRIFYRKDGQRVSHAIDPRTGRPVEKGPASATVITSSAAVADAWATTLMVMGEAGLTLAESEGIAAMILRRSEDGALEERTNALFPEPVARPPQAPTP